MNEKDFRFLYFYGNTLYIPHKLYLNPQADPCRAVCNTYRATLYKSIIYAYITKPGQKKSPGYIYAMNEYDDLSAQQTISNFG
jgi:hypothetical protein